MPLGDTTEPCLPLGGGRFRKGLALEDDGNHRVCHGSAVIPEGRSRCLTFLPIVRRGADSLSCLIGRQDRCLRRLRVSLRWGPITTRRLSVLGDRRGTRRGGTLSTGGTGCLQDVGKAGGLSSWIGPLLIVEYAGGVSSPDIRSRSRDGFRKFGTGFRSTLVPSSFVTTSRGIQGRWMILDWIQPIGC